MANLEDLKRRLKQVKNEIEKKLPDFAVQNTIEAKALIERNIRAVGFGAHYSGNKLPTWFFEGKAKSGAGEAYIERIKKQDAKLPEGEEGGMTWADLRKAEGLPTDHVDLSFTNKMYAGMGPQEPYFNGGIVVCPLGGNTVEVVNKLNWNRDRYGDFLGKMLTPKELDLLRVILLEHVDLIFKNNGF